MDRTLDRRTFLKSITVAGAGLTLAGTRALAASRGSADPVPIGIIGLDTSHSPAFTRLINEPADGRPTGFKVVAAYPYGSRTIESSYSRIPQITEQIREMGVEVVDSIERLLEQVDLILLETNDGNPRLEQSMQVIEAGKMMFVDKPVAASLEDTIKIYEASRRHNVPIFSSSGLRYIPKAQEVRYEGSIGRVVGADAFSTAILEETHPDLFWYGIHGIETLVTVMGPGCRSVTRTMTEGTDVVVGTWSDGRLGTFRGLREGRNGYGGRAFGEEEIVDLGTFTGYGPLVEHILRFFRTGIPPIDPRETLEIYAMMEAAHESSRRGGSAVTLEEVMERAGG